MSENICYGKSPITGEWYLVTEWRNLGEGKIIAEFKEPVDSEEVPEDIREEVDRSLAEGGWADV